MIYHYQDTIITVQPGLGGNNWAICKLKPTGSWTTVKSPDMPRTDRVDQAINNLHRWAEKKKLKRADCGCCYYQVAHRCTKHDCRLKTIKVVILGEVHLRREGCTEFEKGGR